jgi:hypothetical protein
MGDTPVKKRIAYGPETTRPAIWFTSKNFAEGAIDAQEETEM